MQPPNRYSPILLIFQEINYLKTNQNVRKLQTNLTCSYKTEIGATIKRDRLLPVSFYESSITHSVFSSVALDGLP